MNIVIFRSHGVSYLYVLLCVLLIAFGIPNEIANLAHGRNGIVPIVLIVVYGFVSFWFLVLVSTVVKVTELEFEISRLFGLHNFAIRRTYIANIDTSFLGGLYMNRIWHDGKYDFVPYLSRNKNFAQIAINKREN